MLPGKKFTPEDILGILRRRYWLLLVPVAIVSAATAVVVRKLPDQYRAETLILVVPQRVPENYVRSTVTSRLEDRLQSIRQQILSRTRLERIVQEFNLYADERQTQIMEDVIAKMRLDVRIDVVKGDAFTVAYIGSEPRTVMRVTDRLADLFKEENLRDRELMAEGTNQFLETQLADARRRLIEHEKKLEDYKKRFSGELPSQMEANLQVIQNAQMQIQSVVEATNRDRDRRMSLDRQLTDLRAESALAPSTTSSPSEPGELSGSTQQQLATARATLQALQTRLTPNHPDIRIWTRRVRDLEAKADAEALDTPLSGASTPSTPVEALRQRRMADLKAEIDLLDRQIAQKQAEEKRLRAGVGEYERRLGMAPARESELVELTRDYATLQSLYSTLLGKNEEAKISANLERRQIGEQFKLLDPARLPEKPFSPDRQRLNALGIGAGLAIGVLLIGLVEYRDRSFRVDDDVVRVLSLPVLAVVPVMLSGGEQRTLRRRRIVTTVGLASTVMACLVVVVYAFVR